MWIPTVTGGCIVNSDRISSIQIVGQSDSNVYQVVVFPDHIILQKFSSYQEAREYIVRLYDDLNNEKSTIIHDGMVDLMHELRETFL